MTAVSAMPNLLANSVPLVKSMLYYGKYREQVFGRMQFRGVSVVGLGFYFKPVLPQGREVCVLSNGSRRLRNFLPDTEK